MNANDFAAFSGMLIKEVVFGLIFVAMVLLLNSSLVLRIYLHFVDITLETLPQCWHTRPKLGRSQAPSLPCRSGQPVTASGDRQI